MKNVHVSVLANGSETRVTLRPGKVIEHVSGGRHEEGYSYHYVTLYLNEKGEAIAECLTKSCDCDGPLDRGHISKWVADNFAPGGGYWETLQSSQRDYYAEQMGY